MRNEKHKKSRVTPFPSRNALFDVFFYYRYSVLIVLLGCSSLSCTERKSHNRIDENNLHGVSELMYSFFKAKSSYEAEDIWFKVKQQISSSSDEDVYKWLDFQKKILTTEGFEFSIYELKKNAIQEFFINVSYSSPYVDWLREYYNSSSDPDFRKAINEILDWQGERSGSEKPVHFNIEENDSSAPRPAPATKNSSPPANSGAESSPTASPAPPKAPPGRQPHPQETPEGIE